eukprot:359668-Chlamydomonas_euryale.AAC.4
MDETLKETLNPKPDTAGRGGGACGREVFVGWMQDVGDMGGGRSLQGGWALRQDDLESPDILYVRGRGGEDA